MTALETANAVLNFAVPGVYLLGSFLWWGATKMDADIESAERKEIYAEHEAKVAAYMQKVLEKEVADFKRELERKRNEPPAPTGPVSPPWVPPATPGIWPNGPYTGTPIDNMPWSAGQGLQISLSTTSNDWQKTMLGNIIGATGRIPTGIEKFLDDVEATA